MAFGALRGTITGGNTTTTVVATGSVVCSAGDLIVGFCSEAGANTSAGFGDNQTGANTYTAVNAGTLSSVGGRMWYRYVSTGFTLTSISSTQTGSSNDTALIAAVFEGPFKTSPLDRAPANTTDAATPYTCAATGTLTQANELIVAGIALTRGNTVTATSPLTLANNALSTTANTTNSASAAIGYQAVTSTATVTPAFATSSGTIAGGVQVVATFMLQDSGAGAAAGTSIATAATGRADARGAGTAAGRGTASTRKPGLIAFATGIPPSTVTSGIDTTGANLLLVELVWYVGASFPGFTDSYGNTWTKIGSDTGDGQGITATSVYYVNSQTPNVGPGHTISFGQTCYFTAWYSSTAWTFDTDGGGGGPTPITRTTISPTAGKLITTVAGQNNGNFSGLNSGWALLDNTSFVSSVRFASGFAYFTDPSTTTADAIWALTSPPNYITYHITSFTGTWDLLQAVGSATGTGAATGFSSTVTRIQVSWAEVEGVLSAVTDITGSGASTGTGAATAGGRSDARSAGSAAGNGTATAVSTANFAVGSAAGLGTAIGVSVVGTAQQYIITVNAA